MAGQSVIEGSNKLVELIRKACSGDPEAFISLIDLHKGALYKVARGYFSEEMDAEDAVAETVVSCWEKIHTLKKPEYFKTWLIRILINNCNDVIRKRKNLVALDDIPEVACPCFNPGGKDILTIIGALDLTYRVVLLLYYGEGFRVKEISKILELPPGTVTSRLKRGREKLADILKEEEALR